MARRTTYPALIWLVLAIIMLLAALAGIRSASAQATAEQVNLSITPIGIDGSYFDLTLQPGETQQLVVEFGNHGTSTISARTYAADAYTIHGGGFGAKLDGEPATGTTRWLDYPAETLDLAAGNGVLRTFTLSVPAATPPGEYITSIVIQNAVPTTDGDEGVRLNQVHRQAIAVNVTVPGALQPGLTIGDVAHSVAGVVSVVSFTVQNPGNVHLKPAGEFVLVDAAGVEVSRYPIAMDSFYAGTSTQVEIPFSDHLTEGDYTASLALSDARYDVSATSGAVALVVPPAPETIIVPAEQGSTVATTPVDAPTATAPAATPSANPVLLMALGALGGCALVGCAVGCVLLVRRRTAAAWPDDDAPTPSPTPVVPIPTATDA